MCLLPRGLRGLHPRRSCCTWLRDGNRHRAWPVRVVSGPLPTCPVPVRVGSATYSAHGRRWKIVPQSLIVTPLRSLFRCSPPAATRSNTLVILSCTGPLSRAGTQGVGCGVLGGAVAWEEGGLRLGGCGRRPGGGGVVGPRGRCGIQEADDSRRPEKADTGTARGESTEGGPITAQCDVRASIVCSGAASTCPGFGARPAGMAPAGRACG